MPASDCVFCDLITGRGAVSTVYEDDRVLAFLDVAPANPGHTLVIPKRHCATLADLDEELVQCGVNRPMLF